MLTLTFRTWFNSAEYLIQDKSISGSFSTNLNNSLQVQSRTSGFDEMTWNTKIGIDGNYVGKAVCWPTWMIFLVWPCFCRYASHLFSFFASRSPIKHVYNLYYKIQNIFCNTPVCTYTIIIYVYRYTCIHILVCIIRNKHRIYDKRYKK